MSLVKAFKTPKRSLGTLEPEAAAALIATAADMALVTDRAGAIRDVAFQTDDLEAALDPDGTWTGRTLADIVSADSRPKVELLLDEASTRKAPQWRHINCPSAQGVEIPILFTAVRIGRENRVVGFGRDLRGISELQRRLVDAQQSMERDYARLVQMETRYRILFQVSPEPVLILDGGSLRIVEANPAARDLLDDPGQRVVGRAFADFFDAASAPAVRALLGSIRAAGRTEPLSVRLAHAAQEVTVSAHMFRQDNENLCLVRLAPAVAQAAALAPTAHDKLLRLVQSAPDGFVVTSADGHIITANATFLAMAQLADEQQARGQPLDRWLGRPGVDMQVLMAQLRQHGSVRLFATTVRDEFGPGMEVEISAVAITNGGQPCYGFAIRNIGRRLAAAPAPGQTAVRALPRPVEQLTELIGRASLKELVRDATDIIERLCIAAALEMTGDNRASAAEILGLSRQSLYVKLRRYGLGDLAPDGGGL